MNKFITTTCMALMCVATSVASAGDLSITGTGEISVVPDVAYITMGVVTQDQKAITALAENTLKMKQVFKVLADNNVAKKDITTSNFSVSATYTYPDNQPRKLSGYQVTNIVRITVCDLNNLGKVLDTVVTDGANQVSGLSFGVTDSDKFLDRARQMAMKDAWRKARLYGAAGDFQISSIKTVSESSPSRYQPMYKMRNSVQGDSAVPIAQGSQKLSIQVHVVFTIVSTDHSGELKSSFKEAAKIK